MSLIALQSQLTALMTKSQELQTRIDTLQTEHTNLQATCATLTQTNQETTTHIQNLTQELSKIDAATVLAQEEAALFAQRRVQRKTESVKFNDERRKIEVAIPQRYVTMGSFSQSSISDMMIDVSHTTIVLSSLS